MTLNVAQYLAPLNSGQVLNGYSQGVKQGVGITILPDGTITLNSTGAATLGFLTSSITPAPVYNWSLTPGGVSSILINDGTGNVYFDTSYIQAFPIGDPFPHTGAAAIPAGITASRPTDLAGLLRYNTDFDRLEFNNGSNWLPVSPASGGVFSFIGSAAPTANAAGDFWLDTTTNQAYVWTGIQWLPTSPLATSLIAGRVKIGTNVQVALDGTISILDTIGVPSLVSNPGVTTITDNVGSSSIDSALSANQGRLLQQQINALVISNNLTFAGLISGTGVMTFVTPEGTLQGFVSGSPLPGPSVTNDEYFVIVESSGGFTPPGGTFTVVTQGDWFLSTGIVWQFLNVGYDPPIASTTQFGITRLATFAETNAGTDSGIAVTPAGLNNRNATETLTGISEIATQAETNAGLDDIRFVTPLKLATYIANGSVTAPEIPLSPSINGNTTVQQALTDTIYDIFSTNLTISVTETNFGRVNLSVVQATETQRGGAEVATQIETNAGTNDLTIVTPLKLAQYVASGQITAPEIPLVPPINGSTDVQLALTNAVYDVRSTSLTISVTETATGLVDIAVVQATEGQLGGAQIATDAETQALALDTVIVTPLKLGNLFSSGVIDANDILLNPTINGNTDVQQALTDTIYDIASANNSVVIAETATGKIDLSIGQATESLRAGAEIATQVETDAGVSDTTIVTPLKLSGRVSSETLTGIAELATQAETEAGTDDTRIVTPLKLRTAAVYKSDFNAKGDLLSASANDTPLILPVGSNGTVLTADTTQPTGLKWVFPGIYNLDDISGLFDGATLTFNLAILGVPYAPNPLSNISVFLGGIAQTPGALYAYTITGSSITFTSAPLAGTTFYAFTVRY